MWTRRMGFRCDILALLMGCLFVAFSTNILQGHHRCQGLILLATNHPSYSDQDGKNLFQRSNNRSSSKRRSSIGKSISGIHDDGLAVAAGGSSAVGADTKSACVDDHNDGTAQRTTKPSLPAPSWSERFQELLEYKKEHGHTRVPKRYNGGLGVWVNHQRQRRHRLDVGRISMLDSIEFCWDAKHDKEEKEKQQWWERFQQVLSQQQQQQVPSMNVSSSLSSSSLSSLSSPSSPLESLNPSQTNWLRRQRNEYVNFYILQYSSSCKLDTTQIKALDDIDPNWWKTSRERDWDVRCQELLDYRIEHGNCCVPRTHPNRKLANWIINLRKKYKARQKKNQHQQNPQQPPAAGLLSKLTDCQIATLERIDPEWWKTRREREWDAHMY